MLANRESVRECLVSPGPTKRECKESNSHEVGGSALFFSCLPQILLIGSDTTHVRPSDDRPTPPFKRGAGVGDAQHTINFGPPYSAWAFRLLDSSYSSRGLPVRESLDAPLVQKTAFLAPWISDLMQSFLVQPRTCKPHPIVHPVRWSLRAVARAASPCTGAMPHETCPRSARVQPRLSSAMR
jgi:hypothetical protein